MKWLVLAVLVGSPGGNSKFLKTTEQGGFDHIE